MPNVVCIMAAVTGKLFVPCTLIGIISHCYPQLAEYMQARWYQYVQYPYAQHYILSSPCLSDMRILLTFLMYRHARPTPEHMKAWVDNVRYYHRRVTTRCPSSFLNYVELGVWSHGIVGQSL